MIAKLERALRTRTKHKIPTHNAITINNKPATTETPSQNRQQLSPQWAQMCFTGQTFTPDYAIV